ncbi:hypothetical protein D9M73_231090 [compost metagenome]
MGVQPGADEETDLADENERQPVLQHRQPLVAARDGGLAGIDALVEGLGTADLLGGWLDPHRLVAGDLAAFEDGRDVGIHPVVVAVLAAVLHHAHPLAPLLQGRPHVGEHGGRHVRVADQIVG